MPIGALQPDRWEGGRGGSPLCICHRIQLLLLLKAEQRLKAAASGIAPVWNCRGVQSVLVKTGRGGLPKVEPGPLSAQGSFPG